LMIYGSASNYVTGCVMRADSTKYAYILEQQPPCQGKYTTPIIYLQRRVTVSVGRYRECK
jgi:hypothetical protein